MGKREKADEKPKGIASELETVKIADLKPHPRNYRVHPEDQIEHLCASIKEHGLYRNVVVARDLTILAGHGVTLALQKLGETEVRVARLDVAPNSTKALKVLAADNEIQHLVESDDRALTELLKEILHADSLLGTGYDESMLAALAMVSRPASEIADANAAAQWVGLPEYHDQDGEIFRLVVTFPSKEDRARFVEEKQIQIIKAQAATWSARWPDPDREDAVAVRFVGEEP